MITDLTNLFFDQKSLFPKIFWKSMDCIDFSENVSSFDGLCGTLWTCPSRAGHWEASRWSQTSPRAVSRRVRMLWEYRIDSESISRLLFSTKICIFQKSLKIMDLVWFGTNSATQGGFSSPRTLRWYIDGRSTEGSEGRSGPLILSM